MKLVKILTNLKKRLKKPANLVYQLQYGAGHVARMGEMGNAY
jgi:hypothetical protein